MRREIRAKLARRRCKESHKRSMDLREHNESELLRAFLLDQAVWFVVMMLKLLAEAVLNDFTFPEFWRLMYIWEDYIPVLYIIAIALLRHCVTLKRITVVFVTFMGFLPPMATTLWYLGEVFQHSLEVGFPLWENYPMGIIWWAFLLISHFLRCKTIHAFLGLLAVWRLKQRS